MTRRRAFLVAGILTAAVLALTVGVGASFGQFGFTERPEGDDRPVPAASGVEEALPGDAGFGAERASRDDDEAWEERHDDDDRYGEHEEDEEHEEEHEEDEDD